MGFNLSREALGPLVNRLLSHPERNHAAILAHIVENGVPAFQNETADVSINERRAGDLLWLR